jgi:hypothetical protein
MSRNQKRGHTSLALCVAKCSQPVWRKGAAKGSKCAIIDHRSSIIDHRSSIIDKVGYSIGGLEIRSEGRRGRDMLRSWAPRGVASTTTEYM